jgi:hypothetical protein
VRTSVTGARYRRYGEFFAALFTLALGAVFLLALANPALIGKKGVGSLLIIITMEFFIIHSSLFLGVIVTGARKKQQGLLFLLGFSLFYALFFVGYSRAFDEWWPALMFLAMTLTRISRILAGQEVDADEQRMNIYFWAFSMGLLTVCAGGAALLLPDGRHGYYAGMSWTHPQAMLAAGFLYYLLLGLASLLRIRMSMILKHRAELDRLPRYNQPAG